MATQSVTILADPASWHSQKLQAAFRQLGVEPAFTTVARLQARLGGEEGVWAGVRKLEPPGVVLVQNVPGGSLEQVIYRMDVLHQLEDSGVRVINRPGAIEKMVDKYYTSTLLSRAGLRVPQTVVTESMDEAVQAFGRLGQDVVVKPLFGSRGVGMVRLTDPDTAHRVFVALEQGRYLYYLQRFIPHRNEDLRLLMVGEACIAAMLRKATSWKTNVSQGATPMLYDPPAAIVALGRRAAQAVGADYCGVDVMIGEDDLEYVVEVNSMPAWNGLQSVTEVDIALEIARYCLR